MPRTKTKLPYENIALLPNLIAETVSNTVYRGQEWSEGVRDSSRIAMFEQHRLAMTVESRNEFCELCDARCKRAYEADAKWFMKCVNAQGNSGRDQLHVWLTHWLTSYLYDPVRFREHAA